MSAGSNLQSQKNVDKFGNDFLLINRKDKPVFLSSSKKHHACQFIDYSVNCFIVVLLYSIKLTTNDFKDDQLGLIEK